MNKFLIFSVLVLIFLCGCSNNSPSIKSVTCDEMKSILKEKNSYLIDVRTVSEYDESHLDNAINIPVDMIESDIKKHNINYDDSIIVYCRSGKRSSNAAQTLLNLGYKKIYDLGAMSNCNK